MNKKILNYDYFLPTQSTATVGTASVQIAAANQSRTYCFIQNYGSNTIFVSLGSTAVVNKGIMLAAGSAYEMTKNNIYDGVIYGISASAGNLVSIVDGTGESTGF